MATHFEANRYMFSEQMRAHVADLHSFADALLYQTQFEDHLFLVTLGQEGGRVV